MSAQKCISIVHHHDRLLPSSSAQPSPNHSFRLRHHSICRLVLSDDTSGEAGGEMANTGVEIADTLDETLPYNGYYLWCET